MLFNPDTAPGGGKYYFGEFEAAARSSNVEPIAARARSDAEIETVVTSLKEEPRGGLVVMPDFFMFNHVKPIISLAGQTVCRPFILGGPSLPRKALCFHTGQTSKTSFVAVPPMSIQYFAAPSRVTCPFRCR